MIQKSSSWTSLLDDLERRAEKDKPTGGFTGKPESPPVATATAKPTRHFPGKPGTQPAPTATAKPTQHFIEKPGPEFTPIATAKPTQRFAPGTKAALTATGEPTQVFIGRPEAPASSTIRSVEPVKPTYVFTEKPEVIKTIFTTKHGGALTSTNVNANTFGLVSSSAIVPVPIGTGKPAGGRGF